MNPLPHSEARKANVVRIVTLASKTGRYGGPYDTARNQAHLVADCDLRVTLIAGHLEGDKPSDKKTRPGFRQTLPRVYGPWPRLGPTGLFSPGIVRQMFSAIRASDVVHISIAREFIPITAAIFAFLFKKKTILQPHGMLTVGRGRARFLDPLMRQLVRRSNHVIALTETEASQLEQWSGDETLPISIIGNPLLFNPGERPTLHGRAHDVLFVGRLAPRKNVTHFVEAARIAQSLGQQQRYSIVGPDGGDLGTVTHAAKDLPRLNYEGAIAGHQVPSRIANASVLVLTSRDEPWGNAVATAIALGVPVVIPQSAALALSVIKHGSGRVYLDDDVDGLAANIQDLVSQPASHRNAVEGCRKFAEDLLSQSSVREQLTELYVGPR